ncbi:MAG: DNA circularization N-terminal domain-containing protein [Gammaproteobacteria bacterium]|nr:DNA circularization N-terminal domain-containing protein [Gammaproteobacteria bacterium]
MSALSDTRPASFRDVPFLVKRTSTTGGRRLAVHEFVNSDFRDIEDLGPDLRKFSITAMVTSRREANALIAALDKKGEAVLVHPFYGDHTVSSGTYIVDDDMTKLGEISFQLNFQISLEKFVSKKVSTLDDIRNKGKELSDRLGLDVAKDYFNSGLAAINAATDFVNEVADKIESISDMYSQAFNTVSDMVTSVQKLKNDVVNIVNLPSRMANDLNGMLDRIVNIYSEKKEASPDISPSLSQQQQDILGNTDEVKASIIATAETETSLLEAETASILDSSDSDISIAKLNTLEILYDFNKDSIRVSEIISAAKIDLIGNDSGVTSAASVDIGNAITQEQAEIITNEKLLSRLIRIGALSRAYLAAAEIDFSSIVEIEEVQNRLELQYQSVVADSDIPKSTLRALNELRDIAEKYFFSEKLTSSQLINIDINPMPAQVLAFSLYGDTSKTKTLINVNSVIDISDVSGSVQVVTA